MVVELDPGTQDAGAAARRAASIPVTQTLPDVNLDEILAALDADTRDYLHAAASAAPARALRRRGPRRCRRRSSASSRRRATSRAINGALAAAPRATSAASIHNFSLLVDGARRQGRRSSPSFVDSSNARLRGASPTRTRTCARRCSELPGALAATNTRAGKVDRRWRDELGPTLGALRPGARALGPSLRADAAVPDARRRRSSATRSGPFARARAPTVAGPAARRARPRGRHARPRRARFKVAQRAAQRRSPTTRRASEEGYLFWAVVGQPHRRHALRHPGRARPDPPRHRRRRRARRCGVLQQRRRPATRCSARSSRCSTRPTTRRSAARATSRRRHGHGERRGSCVQKQAPSLGRIARRWSVFALSCFGLLLFLWLAFGGPIPLQAQGLPLHGLLRGGRRSSRSEADVRISGVPVGKVKDDRARQAQTGARDVDDRARAALRAAARRTRARSCARRRCWARPTSS